MFNFQLSKVERMKQKLEIMKFMMEVDESLQLIFSVCDFILLSFLGIADWLLLETLGFGLFSRSNF